MGKASIGVVFAVALGFGFTSRSPGTAISPAKEKKSKKSTGIYRKI